MKSKNSLKIFALAFLCLISIFITGNAKAITISSNSPLYAFTYNGGRLRVVYQLKDSTGDVYCLESNKTLPQNGTSMTKVGESPNSEGIIYILNNASNLTMKAYEADGFSYTYTNEYWANMISSLESDVVDEVNGVQNSKVEGSSDYIKKQLAIWYLVEGTIHENNSSTIITDLVNTTYPGLKALVDTAKTKTSTSSRITVSFSGDTSFSLASEGYVSGIITVKSSSNSPITLSTNLEDAKIYYENGKPVTDAISSGSKIMVIIPYEKAKAGKTTINLTGSSVGTKQVVNIYKVDDSTQTVGKLEEQFITGRGSISLNLVKSVAKISKIDVTSKEELPGATIQIMNNKNEKISCLISDNKDGSNPTELSDCTWVSGENPKYVIGLEPGTYYLREMKSPDGYKINTEQVTFTIDESGNSSKDPVTMMNNKESIVKISKVDKTTKEELKGSTLQILDKNKKKIKCIIVDENGSPLSTASGYGKTDCAWVSGENPYYVIGLEPGTYYLKEIKSPDGYELSKEEIKFEIKEGEITQPVVMENSKAPEVPVENTFSTTSMIMIGLGVIFLASGSGLLIYIKRRNRI